MRMVIRIYSFWDIKQIESVSLIDLIVTYFSTMTKISCSGSFQECTKLFNLNSIIFEYFNCIACRYIDIIFNSVSSKRRFVGEFKNFLSKKIVNYLSIDFLVSKMLAQYANNFASRFKQIYYGRLTLIASVFGSFSANPANRFNLTYII